MTAGGSTRVTMLTGACLLQVTPSIWAAYTLKPGLPRVTLSGQ